MTQREIPPSVLRELLELALNDDPPDGFEIGEFLGEGGGGTVFRAVQRHVDREVAIKFLNRRAGQFSDSSSLYREARLLGRLVHQGIARVITADTTSGGRPYFVTELVDGDDIVAHLIREEADLDDVLQLVDSVCVAVGHAHKHGIIHCDLKPSNIRVGQDGRAKVLDFGIAHVVAGSGERARRAGTPGFSSPEQLAGVSVDGRADVYALGIILERALEACGIRPPDEITNLLARATAADATKRITSPTALSDELCSFLRAREKPTRHHLRTAQWALPLLLLCGLSFFALTEGPSKISTPPSDEELQRTGRDASRDQILHKALLAIARAGSDAQIASPAEVALDLLAGPASASGKMIEAIEAAGRTSERLGATEVWRKLLAHEGRLKALSVATTTIRNGDQKKSAGEIGAARRFYREAHETHLALEQLWPNHPDVAHRLSYDYERQFDLAMRRGDSSKATHFAKLRLNSAEALCELWDDHASFWRSLVHARLIAAFDFARRGKTADQATRLREAMQAACIAHQLENSVATLELIEKTHARLGIWCQRNGTPLDSEPHLRASLSVLRKLLARLSSSAAEADIRSRIARSSLGLSQVIMSAGRREESLEPPRVYRRLHSLRGWSLVALLYRMQAITESCPT